MLGRRFRSGRGEQLLPGAEVSGQGWLNLDLTFLTFLKSVMERVQHATESEVQAAVQAHARRLADPDPRKAMDYRSAMNSQAARDWPSEASHDFVLELQKPWAPTPESDEYWRALPEAVRLSYSRQGDLSMRAMLAGFESKAG
jgi:hypothetical protein